MGAKKASVQIVSTDGAECTYRIRWGEREAARKDVG
jgi:hypothetical protein